MAKKKPDLLTMSEIAAMLGRKGGSQTSPEKAKAARANGKLGGRPKKKSAK
jgi:hypothetical protein